MRPKARPLSGQPPSPREQQESIVGSGTSSPEAPLSVNSVTLENYPNAVVKFNATTNNSNVLDVTATGVTIEGITVSNQSGKTNVVGINVESSGTTATINNVVLTNGGTGAVGIALNATGAIVEASNIQAVTGIQVLGSVTATIETNMIDNGVTGVDVEGNATVAVTNNFINGNTGAALLVGSYAPAVTLHDNDVSGNATDLNTYVPKATAVSTTVDAAENYCALGFPWRAVPSGWLMDWRISNPSWPPASTPVDWWDFSRI